MPAAAIATGTDFTPSGAPDEVGCGCGRGGGGRGGGGRGGGGRGGGEVEWRCPTSMLSRAAAVAPITAPPVPSAGSSNGAIVGTLGAVAGVSVAGAASEAAAAAIVGPIGSWASPHRACLAEAGLVRLGRIGWAC
jgi:hypothetical protein